METRKLQSEPTYGSKVDNFDTSSYIATYQSIHGTSFLVMLESRTLLTRNIDQSGKLIALSIKTTAVTKENLSMIKKKQELANKNPFSRKEKGKLFLSGTLLLPSVSRIPLKFHFA